MTGEEFASASQAINVGVELKQALARAAQEQGRDVTSLARAVLRGYLEAHEREGATSSEVAPGVAPHEHFRHP